METNGKPNGNQTETEVSIGKSSVGEGSVAATSLPALVRDGNGLILLSDVDYNQLCEDLGESELSRVISYLSGYCRLHGKSYTDWPFAIRKASEEGWGLKAVGPSTDHQPSPERIQKSNGRLDKFLAEIQEKESGEKLNLEAVDS